MPAVQSVQALQTVLAVVVQAAILYWLFEQLEQSKHAPPLKYLDAEQLVQLAAPVPLQVRQLEWQGVQTVSAVAAQAAVCTVPAAQVEQVLQTPPSRYWPGAQLVQSPAEAPLQVTQLVLHTAQAVFVLETFEQAAVW